MATTSKSKAAQKPRKNDGKTLLRGTEGKPFSAKNQPSPEAKKAGWAETRKRRLLTQEILKGLLDDEGNPNQTFQDMIRDLIKIAREGNPKAIDVICKAIEDDITKVSFTDPTGEPIKIRIGYGEKDAD